MESERKNKKKKTTDLDVGWMDRHGQMDADKPSPQLQKEEKYAVTC